MINTLYGTLFLVDPVACSVVIECAGVGYRVQVSAGTLSKLPSPGYAPDGTPLVNAEKVRLFTYMAVREDVVDLFGFATAEELNMFKLLISVSGVGAKTAIGVLGAVSPERIAYAVSVGDVKAIKAPGVGPKMAARIILELKDKIAKDFVCTISEI